MEEAQPSTVGGDGAPTAMVAVPGLPGALTQAYPLLGGSGTVSMEARLRLRAQDYAAHDRWLVNLQDVITSNRLDDLGHAHNAPSGAGVTHPDTAHEMRIPLRPLRISKSYRRLRKRSLRLESVKALLGIL